MKKHIRHKWFSISGTGEGLLLRKGCERCQCVKGYSPAFGKIMYVDRHGHILHDLPSCVLPNTRL